MEDSNSTLKKEEDLILEVKELNSWHTLMNPGLGKGFTEKEKQQWWRDKNYKYKIGTIRSADLDKDITIFTERFDMSKNQKTSKSYKLVDTNIQKIIKDNGINLSGFEEETIEGTLDTAKTATDFENLYIGWVEEDEKTKTIIKETMKTMFRFIFGKKTINDKNKITQIYKRLRVAYTNFEPYEKVPCKKGSMTEHFRKCLLYRLKGVKMEISAARQIGYPEDNIFIQNLFTLEKGLLMMIKFLDSKSGCFEYSNEYDENDAYISDDENDDDDFARAINLALHIINEDSVDEKNLLEIFRKPAPSGETVSKLIEQINNLLGLHVGDYKDKIKFAVLLFCYTRAKRALELLRSQMDESEKLELQRIKANMLEQLGKIEDDDIIVDIIAGLGGQTPDPEKIKTAITRIIDHLKNVKGAMKDAGDRVKELEASLLNAEQRARDAAEAAIQAQKLAADRQGEAAAAREAQRLAAEAAAAATRRAEEAEQALADEKRQRRTEQKEMEGEIEEMQAELAKLAAAAAAAEEEKNRALEAAAAATKRAEDTEEALRKAERLAADAEAEKDAQRRRAEEAERLLRLAKAEAAKRAADAERERLEAEADAERARLAAEADAKRAADAERARLAAEADAKRAADAEKARLAADAEKARLEEDAEKARLAAEAERKRLADKADLNAERARLDADAEKARLEAEAEAKRAAEEAKRAAEEAKRAAEDEAKRAAEEAKRAAEEDERKRLAEKAYKDYADAQRGVPPEEVENVIVEEIKTTVGKNDKMENIPLSDVVRNIIKDILTMFFNAFNKYDSKNRYYTGRIDDNTDILGRSLTQKIVLANPMTVTDKKSKVNVTELNLNRKEDFWQYVKGGSTSYIFYKLNLDDSIKVLFIVFRRMIKKFLDNNRGFKLDDSFYKSESETKLHINNFIQNIFGFKNESSRQEITKMYYVFFNNFKKYFNNLIEDPKFLETKIEQLGGGKTSKQSKASRLCDLMLTSILLKLDGPEFNYQDLINKGGKVLDDIGQCDLILEMLNNLVDEHCLIKKNDGYTFSSVYIEFEQARALVEAFNNHFTDKEKEKFYSISSGFFNYKVPDEHQTLLGKHPFFLIGRPSSEEVPLYGVIDEEITLTMEERAVLEEDAIPIGAIIFLYIVCFREYQGQDCLPRPAH